MVNFTVNVKEEENKKEEKRKKYREYYHKRDKAKLNEYRERYNVKKKLQSLQNKMQCDEMVWKEKDSKLKKIDEELTTYV